MGMSNRIKPLVSVKTITYNHAPYIARCIESALMQKTTFPFEVVIGEDCSTDGTRDIVMEYARKYPQIIRVITSESNVGMQENTRRVNLACRGDYFAVCEGDDYWIDPLKLQKQYEAAIKYNAGLVVHATFMVFLKDGKLLDEPKLRRAKEGSGFIELTDILSHKTPFHTSSFFMRAEIAKNLPDWYYQIPVGDYPSKVISAQSGKIYYIDEIMSVYQKGVSGSFSERNRATILQEAEREKGELIMYSYLDDFTGHKYSDLMQKYLNHRKIEYYFLHGNLDYLELSEFQKQALRRIAVLTKSFSPAWRRKILGKILDYMQIMKV